MWSSSNICGPCLAHTKKNRKYVWNQGIENLRLWEREEWLCSEISHIFLLLGKSQVVTAKLILKEISGWVYLGGVYNEWENGRLPAWAGPSGKGSEQWLTPEI